MAMAIDMPRSRLLSSCRVEEGHAPSRQGGGRGRVSVGIAGREIYGLGVTE